MFHHVDPFERMQCSSAVVSNPFQRVKLARNSRFCSAIFHSLPIFSQSLLCILQTLDKDDGACILAAW